MNLQRRNNVHVTGGGPGTMVFAHGFGCNQNMWRLLAPNFATRRRGAAVARRAEPGAAAARWW